MLKPPLRKANFPDVIALERLIQYAYRGGKGTAPWTNEYKLVKGPRITVPELEELIGSQRSVVIVKESQDKSLIGCVLVEKHSDQQAYIGLLAVDPDLKSSGTGRQLFEAAEQYGQEAFGCGEVVMQVLSHRDELMNWYKRMGYEETGETKPFYSPGAEPLLEGLHFIVLRKPLVKVPDVAAKSVADLSSKL